jgi:hypothetical protein
VLVCATALEIANVESRDTNSKDESIDLLCIITMLPHFHEDYEFSGMSRKFSNSLLNGLWQIGQETVSYIRNFGYTRRPVASQRVQRQTAAELSAAVAQEPFKRSFGHSYKTRLMGY